MDNDAVSETQVVEAVAPTSSVATSPVTIAPSPPPRSVHVPTPRESSPASSMEVDQIPAADVQAVNNDKQSPPAQIVLPKPKSRAQKLRSPSPVTLPPIPPPFTVRLSIELGGPSNYAVNILELTRETGQRHPTPPPAPRDSDTSDGSDDDEPPIGVLAAAMAAAAAAEAGTNADAEGPAVIPKKRRRRKRVDPNDEYYDTTDPFIDDSDLGIDAPTHFAQTKQKGFYVNSGDVTLVLDEPDVPEKKLRKKRAFIPETPSFLKGKGKPGPKSSTLGPDRSVSTPQPLAAFEPPIVTPSHDPTMTYTVVSDAREEHQDDSKSPGAGAVRITGEGTRDSPIALLDDGDDSSAKPGNNAQTSKRVKLSNGDSVGVPGSLSASLSAVKLESSDSKKRKRESASAEPHEFSVDLLKALQTLRDEVEQADFSLKSKFPTQLRDPLAAAALRAIELEEYGDEFFKALPDIFPYNKFTMTKLVKRLVFERHTEVLNGRMDILLEELRKAALDGFAAAQQHHSNDVARWEGKQEKKRALKVTDEERGGGSAQGVASAAGDADAGNESAAAGKRDREAPPVQRYKMTDNLKSLIWQLVTINNEMAAMTNQMHEWEPDNHPAVSDQSMRKNLYQRIVGAFPEGWMNTGLISREFSNMKRKVQLVEQEVQGDQSDS